MDLWVLAGQSNMEGVGLLDDPRADRTVDPRTAVFTMAGEWSDATEPLHPLWESYTPVHAALLRPNVLPEQAALSDAELAALARTRTTGAGLGPAFASAMADATGEGIGLIPSAHGGTSLEQWSPGFAGADRGSTSTLHGSMLDRIRRALERPGTRLAGVLWYQGETDSTAVRSVDYAARLDAWVAAVREDLGRPDLPVHVVQLARFATAPAGGEMDSRSWDRVQEALRTLPSRVPGTSVVAAVDLELSDPIHVSTVGLRRLGRRLAAVASTGEPGPDAVAAELIGPASNGLLRIRITCSGVAGGWSPASRLPGFELVDRDGVPVPRVKVVDAYPDPADPTAILLVTGAVLPAELAGLAVAYGRGYDPVCLAVDARDLALPCFPALPIV